MKKIIDIVFGIIIIITLVLAGSFIYGSLFSKLPKTKLTETKNLYKYDIFESNESVLSLKIDGKYAYYLSANFNDNVTTYRLIKYNLIKGTKSKEYTFDIDEMYNTDIVLNDNVYVISKSLGDIFVFDKDLEIINTYTSKSKDKENNNYALYYNQYIMTKDNYIYVDDKVFDSVDYECGSVSDIIYNKENIYIYYNNYENNLSCLYDVVSGNTKHLMSSNLKMYDDGIIYSLNNTLVISKLTGNNKTTLMLQNREELTHYSIDDIGKYLLTQPDNSTLYIYNTLDNKLYYSLAFSDDNCSIEDINIGQYAYFIRNENKKDILYIWDYSKDNIINKELSTKSDVDYKFENIKLIQKLNSQYNINIYAYDSSVRYFNDFYVLPETSDIVINEKLLELQDILRYFNKDFFDKFKLLKNNGIKIYFNKYVGPSDLSIQTSNPIAYTTKIEKDYIIAININDEDFKNNFLHELMHCIEININDLYTGNKIQFYPFESWNDYNPNGFEYEYSYVTSPSDKYTTSQTNNVYFVDTYAKTYPNEDRARTFEYILDDEETNVLLQYPGLKKKANYIKSTIIKAYPSMKDSKLFDILK